MGRTVGTQLTDDERGRQTGRRWTDALTADRQRSRQGGWTDGQMSRYVADRRTDKETQVCYHLPVGKKAQAPPPEGPERPRFRTRAVLPRRRDGLYGDRSCAKGQP